MPVPIIPISATPGPRLVPKAGADGKLAAGWVPDLSGTYQPLNATLTGLNDKTVTGSGAIVLASAPTIATATLTNPVVTGGTINNTPIGGTTPAAMNGTTGAFSGDGRFGVAGASAGRLNVNPAAAQVGVIVRSPGSGSANLQEWQNNAGTALVSVLSDGNMRVPSGWQIQWSDSLFHISRPAGSSALRITSGTNNSYLELHNGASIIGYWRGDGRLHLSNGGMLEWNDPSDSITTASGGARTIFSKFPTGASGWTFRTSTPTDVLDMTFTGLVVQTLSSSSTNTVQRQWTIRQNTSGTVANGFGSEIAGQLENAGGTTDRLASLFKWLWNDATSMIPDVVLSAVYNNATEREGIRIRGGASATQIGFFGVMPVTRPTALTTQLTTITHTAPGTPDYALQNLTNSGGYGFATLDEGNTLLSVVANLQTRVAQLETKLQSLGLVA